MHAQAKPIDAVMTDRSVHSELYAWRFWRDHALSDPAEIVGRIRTVQMSTEETGGDRCSIDQTALCLGAGA